MAASSAKAAVWTSGAAPCHPEVNFSPENSITGNAQQLVEQVLQSAKKSIRLAGYTFTSPAIVRSLIAAKRRGVDVQVLVDDKGNHGPASVAALNLLAQAAIPVRTIGVYPIHHDKYIVADSSTVETGSFNFTKAAAEKNSENALVLWNCESIAKAYLNHWTSRWNQGKNWQLNY
ncbi:MAG: phospholipase D family protein [Burkholderiaceae bacterium]|nr:phospholipase D family protein [Burkholderiaceae bacterium]